jgi:Helicase conserved C-terminal domain
MENVVPGALQRLRAADIIRMGGLAAASLGQEYSRSGAVHSTKRQGARLSGAIDIDHTSNASPLAEDVDGGTQTTKKRGHYAVEFEMQEPTSWMNSCSCGVGSSVLCSHAAGLLYQWLAQPGSFISSSASSTAQSLRHHEDLPVIQNQVSREESKVIAAPTFATRVVAEQRGPTPLVDLLNTLSQLGLSELRGIVREYDLVPNGKNKQQLAEMVLDVLRHPEAIRRVALTLEKPQRQLLAALILAGGSMTDDDLRGLYERFSLGHANQLQSILIALQNKALLFRVSLNSSSMQRIGLSGTLLDVGWHVPPEVRIALRVTVPVTAFDAKRENVAEDMLQIQQVEAFRLLADLLLIAKALDGYRFDEGEGQAPHASITLPSDGSVAIPPPADAPSSALLTMLQGQLSRSKAFLRFAVRLLRMADILHKDSQSVSVLRILPDATRLLLGPTYREVGRDLFELWLTQSSYDELYDLQDEGVRLRCRATSLNIPVLRTGELDMENNEARQSLIAILAQAPLEQWISFPAFARFVFRLNPLFLQKRQRQFSTPHWWLESQEGRSLRPTQLSDWMRGEFYYLARLIMGPLLWWGACQTTVAPDGRLLAFRLTPTAGWLFGHHDFKREASAPHSERAVFVDVVSESELLVPCSLTAWPVVDLLETFTQAVGVRGGALCYRLSPEMLGKALSRGSRPEELLALLRSLTAGETRSSGVAQHMLQQLERWINNYGHVRLYTGVTLLEAADNGVMRELAATTSINEQIVRTVRPTLHILKRNRAPHLIDELKRRGQSPLLHNEEL